MIEQWKPVAGYEGIYEVSDLGKVRRLPEYRWYTHWRSRERMQRLTKLRYLAPNLINSGYYVVHLYDRNGAHKGPLIHRLVASAFCDGYDDSKEVNHKDGNKLNNCAVNLEWVSRTYNHLHATRLGLRLQAIRVYDPETGRRYYSKSQACREVGKRGRRFPVWA